MQSVFHFIPKDYLAWFSSFEVRVLCRPLESFHFNLGKHVFINLTLCTAMHSYAGTCDSKISGEAKS